MRDPKVGVDYVFLLVGVRWKLEDGKPDHAILLEFVIDGKDQPLNS